MAGISLGYAAVDGVEGLIRGASLVVDARGIPLDFRYTDPIRPTKLERVLYGNALNTYLREELVLRSLLGAVESKPQIWLCSETDLLMPLRTIGKVKTAFLSQSTHAPLDATGQTEPTSEANVVLLQADSVSAPLRIALPDGTRQEEAQQVAAILVEAAKTMELLEPFGRIQKALAAVGED